MKCLFCISIFCFFVSCQNYHHSKLVTISNTPIAADSTNSSKPLWDSTNRLLPEVHALELSYTVFGCWCPPWFKVSDTANGGLDKHFWLEPANDSLYNPEIDSTLTDLDWTIQVSGQFYEREDYARGMYELEEKAPKAKVFRYTSIKLLRSKPN